MAKLKQFRRIGTSAALCLTLVTVSQAEDRNQSGVVVFGLTGRAYLNPSNGTGTVAGYLTNVEGIDGSLSRGIPSEVTAYLTVVSQVVLQPLPDNGGLSLGMIPAGTVSVYFSPQPSHDWSNPVSFTQGQLVATFARKAGLLSRWGDTANHTYSADLTFSQSFQVNGKSFSFRDTAANGITCSESGPNTPFPGATTTLVTLATAGSCVATGRN